MSGVTRRDFIKSLPGILLLAASCQKAHPTKADKIFDDFPEVIPGSLPVEKYHAPNARRCLVHILQLHGKYANYYPTCSGDVDAVQNDIYTILDFMIREYGVTQVFHEGDWADRKYRHPDFDQSHPYKVKLPEGNKFDACLRLYYEGRLNLRGADTVDTYTKSVYLSSKARSEEAWDLREDMLLKLIAEDKSAMPVAVFGAAHDLLNNVEAWNAVNGSDKFCLVKIVPASLKDIQ